ncbi:hypothetical protein NT6N_16350 [Oceaniferula spumae]|uniref:Anti-sigma factor n=1 Tax=Oceaniferula spumae TaxID=2979115 RepID=A0AAT9FKQ8_9BACT
MDKEQAKFILHSFRPDGADAGDADFQEALQLAVEDRELGEWLADERAADSEFAAALSDIKIPESLRLSLLAVMHGETLDDPSMYEEMDQILQGALAEVTPPAGLRDQILAAMEVEKKASREGASDKVIPVKFGLRKWINVAAVAAALVLGVFFATQVNIGSDEPLASHKIQQAAGRILNAGVTFDVQDSNTTHLASWLKDQNLPAPDDLTMLPPGIREMKSRGCKKIRLPGGKEASLICFVASKDETVHLVIVKNDAVSDIDLPAMDKITTRDCYTCPVTHWNVIRWRNQENTFILLAKEKTASRADMVNYF